MKASCLCDDASNVKCSMPLTLTYTYELSLSERAAITRDLETLRDLPLAVDASAGTLYRQMLGASAVVAVTSARYRLQDANRFALDVEKLGRGFQVILERDGDRFRAVRVAAPAGLFGR